MLSYNVATLLRAAPGTERRYEVQPTELAMYDDLRLAAPVAGEVRLSRTTRSILARASLVTAIEVSCGRCLKQIVAPISVEIEEEALPSIDIDTGQPVDPGEEPDALRLDDHHELELDEPIREAISLAEPIALLCRPDCRGLCPLCGVDLNSVTDHRHDDEPIDPRLAVLADWPNSNKTN